MTSTDVLRPVERRVLRWAERGLDDAAIGERFKRSEGWAAQVRRLASLEWRAQPPRRDDPLRPLERRILRWREQGVDHEELSLRFLRSPEFLARVEEYAQYKLAS
ncbi:MAG TPA: hypothetical protein VFZ68_13180 [Acidimicrobiales bacterium]